MPMDEHPGATATAATPASRTREVSRFLPVLGLLAVVVGLAAANLPTRPLPMCEETLDLARFQSLSHALWWTTGAAVVVALLAFTTLFTKRRTMWMTLTRVGFLLGVVVLVGVQDRAGDEFTQIAEQLFVSQTCDYPNTLIDAPDGLF